MNNPTVRREFLLLKCPNCQYEFATDRNFGTVNCHVCRFTIRPGESPMMFLPTGDWERDRQEKTLAWQPPTVRTLQNDQATKATEEPKS